MGESGTGRAASSRFLSLLVHPLKERERERKSSEPLGASALRCEPSATWAVFAVCCSDSHTAATKQNSDRLSSRPDLCVDVHL